ncbi:MAG: hypothetical protein H6Q33_5527, partial [Deltaproteobacteria bacterium]|nr:hypothetical protein [Deltaproteobacteria bacterium]
GIIPLEVRWIAPGVSGSRVSPLADGRRYGLYSLLGVRAKTSSHSGASAGRADARRRDAGDAVTSSRSGNAADARTPPSPQGMRPPGRRLCSLISEAPTLCHQTEFPRRDHGPGSRQQNVKFLRQPLAPSIALLRAAHPMSNFDHTPVQNRTHARTAPFDYSRGRVCGWNRMNGMPESSCGPAEGFRSPGAQAERLRCGPPCQRLNTNE